MLIVNEWPCGFQMANEPTSQRWNSAGVFHNFRQFVSNWKCLGSIVVMGNASRIPNSLIEMRCFFCFKILSHDWQFINKVIGRGGGGPEVPAKQLTDLGGGSASMQFCIRKCCRNIQWLPILILPFLLLSKFECATSSVSSKFELLRQSAGLGYTNHYRMLIVEWIWTKYGVCVFMNVCFSSQ